MATSVVIVVEQLEGLRMGFGGTLLRADDEGYEDARRVHNGLIDRRPALIARCHGAADVADAVRFARAAGLDVSVRGGGAQRRRAGGRRRRADDRRPCGASTSTHRR